MSDDQASGNVVDTQNIFYLVSGGNTIYESVIEDGIEMQFCFIYYENRWLIYLQTKSAALFIVNLGTKGSVLEFEVDSLSKDPILLN